ncbi:RusA family crossover junction endodeoxyribonuclease [Pseudomonas rhizoryzae]|uniref:RusA family crossover junction endodeoxyribonuclease n=1 Tax=Pseudomonas rhizoryzae TaxID=2571129 RepID=UPI0010C1DA34|nr:RusA family crossover junction endodeoxyribonuclease [Pseudomonas rhizoryzae]
MREFAVVEFVVPGKPIGKGRPRAVTRKRRDKSTGQLGTYTAHITPARTEAYEESIARAGEIAMAGRDLIPHPVMVELQILLPIPQSKSKKWKAQAVAGQVFPTTKPDMDNVIKAIYDGLNGVVWRDDVQVVDAIVRKRYAETPCVRVRIVPLMTEVAA